MLAVDGPEAAERRPARVPGRRRVGDGARARRSAARFCGGRGRQAAGEPHGRSTSFRADRPRTPGCIPPDPGKTLTQVL